MREIAIANSPLVALVDDDVYESVAQFSWHLHRAKQTRDRWYATRARQPSEVSVLPQTVYMHRQILAAPRGLQVDHIDGNGLNNCRSNLRLCTQSLNNANAARPRSPSGYRGVQWEATSWRAAVYVKHKRIDCGRFQTALEAAQARDAKAKEIYGPFAILNFPEAA